MVDEIDILAPAKLNLTLNVVGKRADGYHLLEMVMQSISLFDKLILRKNNTDKIVIKCSDSRIKSDESNIAYKAAIAFFNYVGSSFGVDIEIEKNIPSEAGLGGGSADGAAVLLALDRLTGTNLGKAVLAAIGESVGADIPFCIYQNTALVKGIGELVETISRLPHCYFVVAKPSVGISTKHAFEQIDSAPIVPSSADNMVDAIERGKIDVVANKLFNHFELADCPDKVRMLKQGMLDCGALGACMTGSGSAVFSIFIDRDKADKCRGFVDMNYDDTTVFLCEPYFTE